MFKAGFLVALGSLFAVFIVLFLIAAIAIISMSIGTITMKELLPDFQPPESPTQTLITESPQMIREWTGTGIKTTEPFVIEESPWVIQWSSVPQMIDGESMGILQIWVYNTLDTSFPLTIAANTNKMAADYSYIYETGEFYLTINAANTQWAVSIWAR